MRRFFTGFVWGFILGGLAAYLYQKYLMSAPQTVATYPVGVDKPPDDFTSLQGIGEGYARRLEQAGIRTFAQLAHLSPEEVAKRCQIPLWRVLRYDWIGQAAAQLD